MIPSNNNLTALIITYNEEKNIQNLIDNLNFVDDIIIIDSYSTDNTEQIIKLNPRVTFIQNKFKNYADQRNFGLKKTKNKWILFIDADERINEDLKKEILEIVKNNDTNTTYYMNRSFYFNNKKIKFCGLQKDKNIRLFYNSENTSYNGYVHEKLNHKGKTQTLKYPLQHFSYEDFKSYKLKMQRYGILKAQEKHDKGKKGNLILKYLHPAYTFINKYMLRLGFLDGRKGITLCYLMAYSVFCRYETLEILKKAETN